MKGATRPANLDRRMLATTLKNDLQVCRQQSNEMKSLCRMISTSTSLGMLSEGPISCGHQKKIKVTYATTPSPSTECSSDGRAVDVGMLKRRNRTRCSSSPSGKHAGEC